MNCMKLLLRAIFIIRDLLWQRIIICYLMYKYDIIINDWHQSLNYVIKKFIHMTMTVPIVMIHVLQMLLESYVMIEILIIIQ